MRTVRFLLLTACLAGAACAGGGCGDASFGSDAQTLRPFAGLQEGFVKLA